MGFKKFPITDRDLDWLESLFTDSRRIIRVRDSDGSVDMIEKGSECMKRAVSVIQRARILFVVGTAK